MFEIEILVIAEYRVGPQKWVAAVDLGKRLETKDFSIPHFLRDLTSSRYSLLSNTFLASFEIALFLLNVYTYTYYYI